MSKQMNTTDAGRTLLRRKKKKIKRPTRTDTVEVLLEEPKISRWASGELHQLWKLAESLNLDEIQMLVTKRKQDIKWEKDSERIKKLRTEIKLLEDMYTIKERSKK